MMNRIMLAGTKSGVGKTTISMGLMAALSKTMSVQPYKVGPDYIDSAYHTYITGNKCSNLDSFLMEKDVIKYLFNKNSSGKDISIIEGVMGLFDGAEVGSDIGTSASIAKILNIPVILVVDGSKVASSLAATVKGFELFDKDLKIAGVIINNVGSEKHYALLKDAVEYYTDVKPCGYLVKNSEVTIPERHLGLLPVSEQQDLDNTFDMLSEQIMKTIDIKTILNIANSVKEVEFNADLYSSYIENRDKSPLNIAIASDRAFNFYYNDSLELLSQLYNVKWIQYSPLDNKELPQNIDGLYIGGGFPEVFTDEIEKNISMKKSLLELLESGLPYIAECGGLMYLCETLEDLQGKSHNMIGWLKGKSVMTKRLQRFGYAKLTYNSQFIHIHEFHRSKAEVENETIYCLEKIRSGKVIDSWECGYKKSEGVAAYAHFHFASNPEFVRPFIERCKRYRDRS